MRALPAKEKGKRKEEKGLINSPGFPWFPSSRLGTLSVKLQLRLFVPKPELGNQKKGFIQNSHKKG
jgi:hypothetical protein